jgi:hypothetical protein
VSRRNRDCELLILELAAETLTLNLLLVNGADNVVETPSDVFHSVERLNFSRIQALVEERLQFVIAVTSQLSSIVAATLTETRERVRERIEKSIMQSGVACVRL